MLKGDRLWLRPLDERDMPAYVAGINDTDVGVVGDWNDDARDTIAAVRNV